MSSGLNRGSRIRVDDLRAEHRYNRYLAYCDSKLANLVFAIELQRRFERAAFAGISVAAHPGYAATNLQFAGPAMDRFARPCRTDARREPLSRAAAEGALPAIHAATSPDLAGGAYIGPSGWFESRGLPAPASVPARRATWLPLRCCGKPRRRRRACVSQFGRTGRTLAGPVVRHGGRGALNRASPSAIFAILVAPTGKKAG